MKNSDDDTPTIQFEGGATKCNAVFVGCSMRNLCLRKQWLNREKHCMYGIPCLGMSHRRSRELEHKEPTCIIHITSRRLEAELLRKRSIAKKWKILFATVNGTYSAHRMIHNQLCMYKHWKWTMFLSSYSCTSHRILCIIHHVTSATDSIPQINDNANKCTIAIFTQLRFNSCRKFVNKWKPHIEFSIMQFLLSFFCSLAPFILYLYFKWRRTIFWRGSGGLLDRGLHVRYTYVYDYCVAWRQNFRIITTRLHDWIINLLLSAVIAKRTKIIPL